MENSAEKNKQKMLLSLAFMRREKRKTNKREKSKEIRKKLKYNERLVKKA